MVAWLGALAIEGALFGLSWAYHRLTDKPKETPVQEREEFAIPITEQGAAIPHVFGRARVRRPILAWSTDPEVFGDGYSMQMLFSFGVGWLDGTQKLHQVWAGDVALEDIGIFPLEDQTGDGNFEDPSNLAYVYPTPGGPSISGLVEFLNGNSSQLLVETTVPYNPLTNAGELMSTALGGGSTIPGYRGLLSAFFFGTPDWSIGRSSSLPAYSFDVSSFPSSPLYLQKVGDDCNPADVIWRVLTGGMGMLGLPESWLDYESFLDAATRLHAEGHGYSRVITDHLNAQELLADVLRQIDAVLFVRPLTGLITIKLVRYDYNSRDVPTINPDNCSGLEAFEAGGLVGLPNKVRVTFTDRAHDYSTGSAQTHSFVAAVGQSAQGAEVEIPFVGCCTQELADTLAARELEARSRPLTKCTATVSREFWDTCPGDVVWLFWPEYGVNMLMRVGNVDRGGRDDNSMRLDLIQEFFQVRRFELDGTGLPHHPGGTVE